MTEEPPYFKIDFERNVFHLCKIILKLFQNVDKDCVNALSCQFAGEELPYFKTHLSRAFYSYAGKY